MSNYLNQIASKSLNRLPVVHPRLAETFESSPEGLPVATTPIELESETISEQTRSQIISPVSPQNPGEHSQKIDDAASAIHSDRSPVVYRQKQPLQPQNISSLSDRTPSLPIEFPETPLRDRTPTERATSDLDAINLDAPNNNKDLDVPKASHSFLPEIKPSQTLTSQQSFTDHFPTNDYYHQPSLIKPQKAFSAPFAATSLINTTITNSSNYSSILSSSKVQNIPPPTIQVTIGQINVRAIAAKSSPRQTSRSRPAKPSLEKYLQSRSKGTLRQGGIV